MFDSIFELGIGGAHLQRDDSPGYSTLRFIKTPQQANAKWVASTSTGEQTWVDNLNATQKPIVQAAVDARAKMQTRFAAATAPGGVWETHLLAVTDQGVKSAATAKRANYSTGVGQASQKQLRAITKIIAYETQALTQLTSKSQAGSGKTRMNEWFDLMSAAAGTLGA